MTKRDGNAIRFLDDLLFDQSAGETFEGVMGNVWESGARAGINFVKTGSGPGEDTIDECARHSKDVSM